MSRTPNDTGRIPEGWQLEEECHRNAALVMLMAHHLPKLAFHEPVIQRVEGNIYKVRVTIENERAIPSMLAVANQFKRHRPDIATLAGAKVLAGGLVQNAFMNEIDLVRARPERLLVPGVEGFGTRQLYFLVEGQGELTLTYDSLKAGKISRKIMLP